MVVVVVGGGGGGRRGFGGKLPLMAYLGRLHPEGVLFQARKSVTSVCKKAQKG